MPVQKISGPVVTIGGGIGTPWPSCAYSSVITQRPGAPDYPDAGRALAVVAAETARRCAVLKAA